MEILSVLTEAVDRTIVWVCRIFRNAELSSRMAIHILKYYFEIFYQKRLN